MATGCTDNYYAVDLVGIVTGPLGSDGAIVTFDTPTPVWTEADGTTDAVQCSAVALGGFNGLNS